MLRWCAPGRGFDSGASLGLVCKFLFVRVSSKFFKHATSYHLNNVRRLLGNTSFLLLNFISPTNPFLNIKVSKNFAFQRNTPNQKLQEGL
jgi:hypothetical protein